MWVFGYGSLMWRPGFRYQVRRRAALAGARRAFCVRTVHHRGRPMQPGLVLGLKPAPLDQVCEGIAYQVRPEHAEGVRAYLKERELDWYPVYFEAPVEIALHERRGPPRPVGAITYLPKLDHPDFLPNLTPAEAAAIIREASGVSGTNVDYVQSTVAHLRELGIDEPEVEAVAAVLAM